MRSSRGNKSVSLPGLPWGLACRCCRCVPSGRHGRLCERRGEAERILSLPANLLGRLHGVCPGATTSLLGAVNRLLPESEPASASSALGMEVQQRMHSRLLDVLTGL